MIQEGKKLRYDLYYKVNPNKRDTNNLTLNGELTDSGKILSVNSLSLNGKELIVTEGSGSLESLGGCFGEIGITATQINKEYIQSKLESEDHSAKFGDLFTNKVDGVLDLLNYNAEIALNNAEATSFSLVVGDNSVYDYILWRDTASSAVKLGFDITREMEDAFIASVSILDVALTDVNCTFIFDTPISLEGERFTWESTGNLTVVDSSTEK